MSDKCDLKIERTNDSFLTKSKLRHKNYCESKEIPFHPLNGCKGSEGCSYDWKTEKCTLDYGGEKNSSLAATYLNGGFGFGKICMDREFTRVILLFLFPPLYVYLYERENGFEHYGEIILSAVYTYIFYVPGLIHALMYKHKRNR